MAGLTERGWYRRAEWVWYAVAIAYDAFWIGVIGSLTAPYGVNIYVLGAVVIVCSVPYAISTAKVVRAALERRTNDALRWAMVAVLAFFAPDIYVLAAGGKRMPWYLLVGFIAWMTLAALLGIRGVVKKIRVGRAQPRPAEEVALGSGSVRVED
ncbi:MAG: hypothetical protein ACOYNI_04155 [Acidimicrobiia bacterium]